MKCYKLLLVVLCLLSISPANLPGTMASQGQNKAASETHVPITIGETWRMRSKQLGEEREISVYLPASYVGSKQRYPVIYALDGETIGPAAASAVQFMTGASEFPQMAEALVVAVPNTNRERDMPIPQEYAKSIGKDNFLAFLADELIPAIEQKYRTQPLRILIGHSQGGLFIYHALTTRPTAFQWYLPIDAPFVGFPQLQPLVEKARTMITKTPNYRGRLVTIEKAIGWLNEWPSLIEAAPKSFYGAQVKITDETHETMVYKGIYEGLKRLFYDFEPATKDAKLLELATKYQALSEAYGYQVDIPQRVLLRSASRNLTAQNGTEAAKLIQRAIALYGESATTNRLMAQAEAAIKKGGPDPRVAEFLNMPPPSAEQMQPFLGVWAGRLEVPDGVPLDIVLTFAVEGGVVRGRSTVSGPGGGSFQMQSEFIRVVDGQTLQWGRRGRGAGVVVSTGKLVDANTLKGGEEDIGAPSRPGMTFQPITFTFKRKTGDK
jgi:uncharacterized protein